MTGASSPLALVLIAGPQASGKSTVATALADALRRQGELVALVELDRIAGMALPTLPDWGPALAIFESVVGQWARAGLTCVVAEGSGNRDEVERLRAQAPSGAAVVVVVLSAPLDVALARAQADPSRGISRDRAFLSGVYERWAEEMPSVDADVVLDTGDLPVAQSVVRIRAAVDAARSAPSTSR